jgi:predicted DNA-binding antitoxin AbrB/MazE fold protein
MGWGASIDVVELRTMSKTIHAVFSGGVFRPVEPVDLPDPCEVEVEVRSVTPAAQTVSLDDVYAILGKRFDSGQRDVAERHNI